MKTSITVDGMIQPQPFLVLVNDFRDHWAEVLLETTPESVSAPESVASSSA
jgi:hypothetical protein